MQQNSRKRVIIITIALLIALVIAFTLRHIHAQNSYNLDNQNLAIKTLELPNGSKNNIYGWIGVNITDLTQTIKDSLRYSDENGVYVEDTLRDNPAQTAGLLPGDIILKINNMDANEVATTLNLISALQPGHSYPFTVFRQGKYLEYVVKITHRPNFV